jgi:predicted ABC-type ATPase
VESNPQFHILAGPNGSGKSTYANAWKTDFTIHNPDEIAKSLAGYDGNTLIEAGRIIHNRMEEEISAHKSFGVETTLSGHQVIRQMKKCKSLGYKVYLHFIYVEKLAVSRARVIQRVKMGGHGVPEEDQIRRFDRSFANLPLAIQIADTALVFNNSEQSHRLIAVYDQGRPVFKAIKDEWLP